MLGEVCGREVSVRQPAPSRSLHHTLGRSVIPASEQHELIHELSALFSNAFKKFASEVALESGFGATPSQLRFLQLLVIRPGISLVEAARSMAITTPSACTALSRLTSLGWVAKYRDPNDKRCWRLELTEDGQTLVDEFETAQVRRLNALLRKFTEEEVSVFRDLARRITAAIAEV